MIEAIQTFLDLNIEPRGAMLSLRVLNPEVTSSFGLDNNTFNCERGGRSVFLYTR